MGTEWGTMSVVLYLFHEAWHEEPIVCYELEGYECPNSTECDCSLKTH